jgi:hypothetical protein
MRNGNHSTHPLENPQHYQMKGYPLTGQPFKQIPDILNTWLNGERGPSLNFIQPPVPHYNINSILEIGQTSNIKPTSPQNSTNGAHNTSQFSQALTGAQIFLIFHLTFFCID